MVPETILDLVAEFLNKLAGCDFDKSLNVMVLQKRAPAKSHEKTWELAGRFSVSKPCNRLTLNKKAEKRRRGLPANLFSFLVLKYAHVVAPQPEYTTSGCYEIV